jgi:hypothetical protein
VTPEMNQRLERLGAQARHSTRAGGTAAVVPGNGFGQGGWSNPASVNVCEIVDKGTGAVIATGEGGSQLLALEAALAAADRARASEPPRAQRPTQVSQRGRSVKKWDGRSVDRW